MQKERFTVFLLFVFLFVFGAFAETSTSKSAKERGLVTKKVHYSSIVKHHAKYCQEQHDHKHFPHVSLGFVTPWNNHGYDTAKEFGKKFSLISPTWFNVQAFANSENPSVVAGFEITGQQDIDAGWIQDVRNANPQVKIVPRINFGNFQTPAWQALLKEESLQVNLISDIVTLLKDHGFDGLVLDTGYLGLKLPGVPSLDLNPLYHFHVKFPT